MRKYSCHKIAGGLVKGELLFSRDAVCFYLIDPKTGVVIEKEHCLYGRSITGKILVFPYGKASSVVQAAWGPRAWWCRTRIPPWRPVPLFLRHPW